LGGDIVNLINIMHYFTANCCSILMHSLFKQCWVQYMQFSLQHTNCSELHYINIIYDITLIFIPYMKTLTLFSHWLL
jgi:hypothetical protein